MIKNKNNTYKLIYNNSSIIKGICNNEIIYLIYGILEFSVLTSNDYIGIVINRNRRTYDVTPDIDTIVSIELSEPLNLFAISTNYFAYEEYIKQITFININTQNITDMSGMFAACSNLSTIDGIKDWDTSKVTNMLKMFLYCKKLTDLDIIKDWDVSNVTNMSLMFCNCKSLTELDLSSFNTNNVIDISHIFDRCSKLFTLDLSNWNCYKTCYTYNMFYNCTALKYIYMYSCNDTTVDMIASEKPEQAVILRHKVDFMDQWQDATDNLLDGYIVYESFSNYNIDSKTAMIKIWFKNIPNFTFKYRSDAETTYDYLIIGKLDTELSTSNTYSSSTVQYHTRGSQETWKDATYSNDGEEHFIMAMYLKDSSQHKLKDKAYIAIPVY